MNENQTIFDWGLTVGIIALVMSILNSFFIQEWYKKRSRRDAFIKKYPDCSVEVFEIIKLELINIKRSNEPHNAYTGLEGRALLEGKNLNQAADLLFEKTVEYKRQFIDPHKIGVIEERTKQQIKDFVLDGLDPFSSIDSSKNKNEATPIFNRALQLIEWQRKWEQFRI